MLTRCLVVAMIFTPAAALASDAMHLLAQLTWEQRVLLVFSPHGGHADYRRQVELLAEAGEGLRERDLTVVEAFADGGVVIDGQAREFSASSLYRRFAVERDAFRAILLGKDGTVKLDSDDAVTSAELFALIDAMPMRRLEMQRDD